MIDIEEAQKIGFNASAASGRLDELFLEIRNEMNAVAEYEYESVGLVESSTVRGANYEEAR